MQTLQAGYRGLSLLVLLNKDNLLFLATLAVALASGALIGRMMLDQLPLGL